MNRIFGTDGYLSVFFERTGMMIKLNLITILFSLPVVSMGAAVTAMNDVSMRIDRGEEGYVFRDFFRAFKQNWKQATSIWIFMLIWIIINLGCVRIIEAGGLKLLGAGFGLWCTLNLTVIIVAVYAFAVLARFEETTVAVVRHAFALAFYHVPYTAAILTALMLPAAFLYYFPQWFLMLLLFGLSFPAAVSAHFFNRIFLKGV